MEIRQPDNETMTNVIGHPCTKLRLNSFYFIDSLASIISFIISRFHLGLFLLFNWQCYKTIMLLAVHRSSHGCTWEVWYTRASITRYMYTKARTNCKLRKLKVKVLLYIKQNQSNLSE